MREYDFSDVEEMTGGYGPGKHMVTFGEWQFQESNNGKPYLYMRWENNGSEYRDMPFASSRLYFSSKIATGISKHTLHLLCDKMGIAYTKDLTKNSKMIEQLGRTLRGKEIEIELVPTGETNPKGHPYLGVHIDDVGDFFIKKQDDQTTRTNEVSDALGGLVDESVPF